MLRTRRTRKLSTGVFTDGYPGLPVGNLGLLTEEIRAIDWHAPLDLEQARTELIHLRDQVLKPLGLKLDAVVFGLDGESYADPATARKTVGFAAIGIPRRNARFAYAKQLAKLVAEIIPARYFIRKRVTLKGHFGAFKRESKHQYAHLVSCLQQLREETLLPNNILMLAETGCESAKEVIILLKKIGLDTYGANWDTANLLLWGVPFDNIAYGRALSKAGALRGVHIKGGLASSKPGITWGSEVDPNDLATIIEILLTSKCFDGPVIVEREMFLPAAGKKKARRETPADKAAGLSRTLRNVKQINRAFQRFAKAS